MAANFWLSTHWRNWTSKMTMERIKKGNREDQSQMTEEEIEGVHQYIIQFLQTLGKKFQFRQQVMASAVVFYRRFYLSKSFTDFDPRLVGATVLYLAAKTEECQVRVDSIVKYISYCTTDKNDRILKFRHADILECEFYVVEALRFDLVIYHPYRPLTTILADLQLEDVCLQTAWSIVNDAYRTEVILLSPPYIIALASIYLGCIYVQRDPTEWFNKLNVNQKEVLSVVQRMLEFYRQLAEGLKYDYEKIIAKLNEIAPASMTA